MRGGEGRTNEGWGSGIVVGWCYGEYLTSKYVLSYISGLQIYTSMILWFIAVLSYAFNISLNMIHETSFTKLYSDTHKKKEKRITYTRHVCIDFMYYYSCKLWNWQPLFFPHVKCFYMYISFFTGTEECSAVVNGVTMQQAVADHTGNGAMFGNNQAVKACGGCGGRIIDRYLLHAMDRYWHTGCLKCSCCQTKLEHLGSCFSRSGMILCKNDYIRYVLGIFILI